MPKQGSFDVRAVIGCVNRNDAGDYLFKCVMGYGAHRYLTEMRVGQDDIVEMVSQECIDRPSRGRVH
jgi:hypothetical protein